MQFCGALKEQANTIALNIVLSTSQPLHGLGLPDTKKPPTQRHERGNLRQRLKERAYRNTAKRHISRCLGFFGHRSPMV